MKHFCLILATLLLWNCSSGEDAPEAPKIEITDTNLLQALPAESGTGFICFSTNGAWSVQTDQNWISASPSQGEAGNHTLQITADENTQYDERNAKLTISCGTVQEEFTITQKQKDALLLTSSKVEINADGGEFIVEVKSNVQFTYEIEKSAKTWLRFQDNTNTRGLVTSALLFSADENMGTDRREGTITIHYGDLSEEVKIYQEGIVPSILLTQNEYTVPDAGTDIQIELKSNVDYQMELPDVNWISEVKTRAMSSYTHYITIAPNKEYNSREAYITFTDHKNGIVEKVHIVQMQKDAIIVARNEYDLDYQANVLSFDVETNVELNVEANADWIKQVQTRGMHTETLNFNIDENSGEDVREGVIAVSNGKVKQEVRIRQAPKPVFEITQKEFMVESCGKTIDIEIKSNIAYRIQLPENTDWITQTPTRAATLNTEHFIIAANESHDNRKAEIVFFNTDYGIAERISVTQMQKDAIVLAKNEYIVGSKGGDFSLTVSTNVEITPTMSVDWITTPTTRGLQDKVLKFNIGENETDQIRQGVITLSSGSLKQEVKITQEEKGNDRDILINLYNATDGINWPHQNNWCSDKPLNEWYGVTTNQDGKVTELYFNSGDPFSPHNVLKGDASFNGLKKLKQLVIGNCQLTSLDVSGCPSLSYLNIYCKTEALTSWKLSESLESIHCYNLPFTSIDLSICTRLKDLTLAETQISSIDLSKNPLLSIFDIHGSALQSINNIKGCHSLTSVSVNNTSIKDIDLSEIETLNYITIGKNPQLTQINVTGCKSLSYFICRENKLSALDVSGLTNLNELQCWNNELTNLNVTGCIGLGRLWCNDNKLTSLDFSSCIGLTELACDNNSLTSLDASNKTLLRYIHCEKNQLTSLNVSGCSIIEEVHCYDNKIAQLDLSNLPQLKYASCKNNEMGNLILTNTNDLYIDCSYNQLTSLDASSCQYIECMYNNLSELKVGKPLFMLHCSHNQLSHIDFSACENIAELSCSYNQLTTLDVSATQYGFDGGIDCSYNKLTSVVLYAVPFGFNSEGNLIETISFAKYPFDEPVFQEYFKFTSWGDNDPEIYKEPEYRNGHQYPRFIIREQS